MKIEKDNETIKIELTMVESKAILDYISDVGSDMCPFHYDETVTDEFRSKIVELIKWRK
jgi:hypothetical protein